MSSSKLINNIKSQEVLRGVSSVGALDFNNGKYKYRKPASISSTSFSFSESDLDKITDGAIALSEGFATGKFSESSLTEKVKGIELGEKAEQLIKSARDNDLEFSDGVSINQNTLGPLGILSQLIGSYDLTQNETSASLFLPDKTVEEWTVTVDRMGAQSGYMPYAGYGSNRPSNVKPLDPSTFSFTPGLWALLLELDAVALMYQRELGGKSYADRGYMQYFTYNMNNIKNMALTTKEIIKNDSLAFGSYGWGANTVNMGIPAQNFLTLPTPIGAFQGTLDPTYGFYTGNLGCDYTATPATYNPWQSLVNLLTLTANLTKYKVKAVYMNRIDYQNFIQTPAIINYLTQTSLFGSARDNWASQIKEMKTMMENFSQVFAPNRAPFPIVCDDSFYVPQDDQGNAITSTTVPFIPYGTMYVQVDIPAKNGPLGAFHLCNNPYSADPLNNPQSGFMFNAFQSGWQTGQQHAPQYNVIGSLCGGSALYTPENMFVVNGLYSNVSGMERLDATARAYEESKKSKK